MELTKEEMEEILRLRQYFSYRQIWIAEGPDGKREIICKATAHTANARVRKGFKVVKVVR